MATKIWLRAETKPQEERSALTPSSARLLLESGFEVYVERSFQAAIPTDAYSQAGCKIVTPGSWEQAPDDAYILGLKELPDDGSPLRHRHIYFAHTYKEQQGWQETLDRFDRGGGTLLDIEYLVDDAGRRVAAFGYWAGFAGAAVAIMTWCGQQLGVYPVVPPLQSFPNRDALINHLQNELQIAAAGLYERPTIMVIGAKGRVGTGASALAAAMGLPITRWDIEETVVGGPFEQILAHDIFINCVLVNSPIPPFVTREMLTAQNRQLSVVSDVSCDPYGDYNPIPIYTECTNFEQPAERLIESDNPLDLVAIDHLPSLLPVESSEDFSRQLLPHLLHLEESTNPVWDGARDIFKTKLAAARGG
ncbi:MAG: saccharopine dehydrogenase [Pseudomonadota bacterium]